MARQSCDYFAQILVTKIAKKEISFNVNAEPIGCCRNKMAMRHLVATSTAAAVAAAAAHTHIHTNTHAYIQVNKLIDNSHSLALALCCNCSKWYALHPLYWRPGRPQCELACVVCVYRVSGCQSHFHGQKANGNIANPKTTTIKTLVN